MKLPIVSNLIINDMTWGDALLRGNLSTCTTDKILNDLAQALDSLSLKLSFFGGGNCKITPNVGKRGLSHG
jgi:hypothetical protein